jgi:hypothetical protein
MAAELFNADGRMGMAKLIVSLHNFANVPKIDPFFTLIIISCETITKIFIMYYLDKRIRWFGRIERMQDTAIPQKMLYGKLYATRRRGRPKTRWLDDVFMDLRKMGINERRDRVRDREAWKRIVMEAKARLGL